MNAWTDPLRFALGLGLLAVIGAGCNDDAGGAFGADTGDAYVDPITPDAGGEMDAGPDCALPIGNLCGDDEQARCLIVRRAVDDGECIDTDEDCFPGDCGALARFRAVLDCDDDRADVNPAATELCDGIDHDCDGNPIGSFELGGECSACGLVGKTECAVDDPTTTACSVRAGQSDAPDPLPDEVCNAVDDDCDGLVDESCFIEQVDDAERTELALCPDGRMAVVEDGGVVLYDPEPGAGLPVPPSEGSAIAPHCGPAGLAWLEATGDCVTPADGPVRCPSAVWFIETDGVVATPIAAPGSYGPPTVGTDAVWWHSAPGDDPVVVRRGLDEMVGQAAFAGAFSDPSPPVDGLVTVREWLAGEPRVKLIDLETGGAVQVDDPRGLGWPGPPRRSADWIAWSVRGDQEVLWVVDGTGMGGFRPSTGAADQSDPRVAGSRVAWVETAGASSALMMFDLQTGMLRTVAEGDIAVDGFDIGPDRIAWIDQRFGGGRIYQRTFAPTFAEPDPEPDPDPDGGMNDPDGGIDPDLGVDDPDAGAEDPDAGIDPDSALEPDAGM